MGTRDETVYVFFTSRPCDKGEAWPCIYQSKERAEAAQWRVSPVVEVVVPVTETGGT